MNTLFNTRDRVILHLPATILSAKEISGKICYRVLDGTEEFDRDIPEEMISLADQDAVQACTTENESRPTSPDLRELQEPTSVIRKLVRAIKKL